MSENGWPYLQLAGKREHVSNKPDQDILISLYILCVSTRRYGTW